MATIRELLNRRNDLSTFVVHLTRQRVPGVSARTTLETIIAERRLRALSPMGWAKTQDFSESARQSQRCVSFSETPLEHIYSLYTDVDGREIRLQPYGVAMTKVVARQLGVNPVWYVDMTTRGGREWHEARALDELRDGAIANGDFHASPLAKVMPFFEQMGTWPSSQKEFWWEREWRCRGELDLTASWAKLLWLCPDEESNEIEACIRASAPQGVHVDPICIDPGWGIEELIARLCKLDPRDVSLFHATGSRRLEDGRVVSSSPI